MTNDKTNHLISFLIILILILPFAFYVYRFGYHFSTDHQRWAEFGAIMSGIYTPIIAFLALLVLINQTKAQIEINKHHYDQTYIQENRKDLNFYIEKLEQYLELTFDGEHSIKDYLQTHFGYVSDTQLLEKDMKVLASALHEKYPKVFDIWLAIYPILTGLSSQDEYPYFHNATGSKLRISVCLQYKTCVAIDNYYFCLSNDLQKGKYFFRETS